MTDLTGLTIEKALQYLLQEGIQGQVVYTSAPVSNRKADFSAESTEREERVIARRGNTLIVSRFSTILKEETERTDE